MPHPFSFLLPQLACEKAPEEKRSSSKAEPHNSHENPILFSSFTKHFKKIENPEIKEFLKAIEKLDEKPAPYTAIEVYERFNPLFSNSKNVEIVLKAILEARANVLGKLSKTTLKNQKTEVDYLLESEKRRRFMGRVILCLKDNFFQNHNEYSYDFIKQFSEDLKINTYNLGMGFYFEYFSTENTGKLHDCLEQESLPLSSSLSFVYSALQHWLPENNSVDQDYISLVSLVSYPSSILQYKAAFNLSIGQIDTASEYFLKSEKFIQNSKVLFLALKEEGWEEAESFYQSCVDKEKEDRTDLENDYKNSLRTIYLDILKATKIFQRYMLGDELPLSRNLEDKLANYCKNLSYDEKLNADNLPKLKEGINLLYIMMENSFCSQIANVYTCEIIAKKLKISLLKVNNKNLVLLQAINKLDSYLEKLEKRKTAISNLAQDRADELKTMQAQEAVQAALESKKAKKVVKEKSSDKEKELSIQIMQLTKNLNAALEANKALKGKMKNKEDTHKQKAKGLQDQIETLNEKVEELTAKYKTSSETIEQLESSTSQSKIDELSASLQKQKSDNTQLQQNNAALSKKVEQLNLTLGKQAKRTIKISDLRTQLEAIKIERDAAAEMARKKSSIENQAQLTALQARYETLTKNLEDQLAKKQIESAANQAAYHYSLQANSELAQAKAVSDQSCQLLVYQLGAATETAAAMQAQVVFYSNAANRLGSTLDATLVESMQLVKTELPYLSFYAHPSIVLTQHLDHIQSYLIASLEHKKDFHTGYKATIKEAMRKFGGSNSQNYYSLIHLISGSHTPLDAFQRLEKQKLIGSLICPKEWPIKWKYCFNPDWRNFVELQLGRWQKSNSNPISSHFPFLALMLVAPYYYEKSTQQNLSIQGFIEEFLTAFTFTSEETALLRGQLAMHLSPNVKAFEQYLKHCKKEVIHPQPAPMLIIRMPKKTKPSALKAGSDAKLNDDPSSDKKTPSC